jgi:hypothetical protein
VKSPFIPLFQRGKKRKEFSIESPKAVLPLKKGGQEGFLARAVQSAKVLRLFTISSYFMVFGQVNLSSREFGMKKRCGSLVPRYSLTGNQQQGTSNGFSHLIKKL